MQASENKKTGAGPRSFCSNNFRLIQRSYPDIAEADGNTFVTMCL